jgi:hypothetical protein
MEASAHYSSDVAFTRSVKAQQRLNGSRGVYERMEQAGSWETVIPPGLRSFVESQTSNFLACVSDRIKGTGWTRIRVIHNSVVWNR